MQIQDPIATTNNCRYCLMCRHVCPVGHVTRLETLTPHGWGLTIQSVERGLLTWNEDTVTALYSCADCGTCRANCVTDQPLPSAIAAARAGVAASGLAPAAVTQVGENLAAWGNPYEKPAPLTDTGAIRTGEVALFVGDEAFFRWPTALVAARTLLQAVGIEPVEIGVGRSNGYLPTSLGFPEIGRTLVQATLDELAAAGAHTLLVLSPGDYFMFHQLMDERLGVSWPEEVQLIELTTYLYDQWNAGDLVLKKAAEQSGENEAVPYAYVDPTHAVRVPTRHDAPRALLQAVMPKPGLELFWRRDRAHPVGSGALQFTSPHIANHLTYSRLGDLVETGARLAITEDPGSLSQLSMHADRFKVRIQGLFELLAEKIAP